MSAGRAGAYPRPVLPVDSAELRRVLKLGGFAVWLMVGAPVFINGAKDPRRLVLWAVAYAGFGLAFRRSTGPSLARGRFLALLAVEVASILTMVLLLCDGFEGALLVLVALSLGGVLPRRSGAAWIAVQSALLAAAIAIHWSPRQAILLSPPYLGFQLLAFLVADLYARDALARRELARANEALRAAQDLTEDNSRLAERLRIARELHDAVGHHLTALSLHLEVAARLAEGRARDPVTIAQQVARLLLEEVRGVVDELRDSDRLDLGLSLGALAAEMPRPQVLLTVPDALCRNHVEEALIVLRCTQEIVTNAARHADADHLWIEIEQGAGWITLAARDDGRGSERVIVGNGLSGMRERIERVGGELSITTAPGQGFSVRARFPLGARAAAGPVLPARASQEQIAP